MTERDILYFEIKANYVRILSNVLEVMFTDIDNIKLKVYEKNGTSEIQEFIVLTWTNGGISTANNNINSLSATVRNIARMLDGGVYENIDFYRELLEGKENYTEIV